MNLLVSELRRVEDFVKRDIRKLDKLVSSWDYDSDEMELYHIVCDCVRHIELMNNQYRECLDDYDNSEYVNIINQILLGLESQDSDISQLQKIRNTIHDKIALGDNRPISDLFKQHSKMIKSIIKLLTNNLETIKLTVRKYINLLK